MPTVSAINTTSNPLADGSFRTPVQTLGQKDFLKLLVTQMSQQDPMNPVKDAEFIAQMAQFSALEQSKTMMSDMSSLRAASMLGDTVQVKNAEDLVTGTTTGMVSAVLMEEGVPKLVINGGRFELADVLSITPTLPVIPTQSTTPGTATQVAPTRKTNEPDWIATEVPDLVAPAARPGGADWISTEVADQ